jgi:hypothetical protein
MIGKVAGNFLLAYLLLPESLEDILRFQQRPPETMPGVPLVQEKGAELAQEIWTGSSCYGFTTSNGFGDGEVAVSNGDSCPGDDEPTGFPNSQDKYVQNG